MSMSSDSSLLFVHEVHEIALLAAGLSCEPPSLDYSLRTSSTLEISEPSPSSRSSACSSPQYDAPTVKFAPLPQTDPHRQRSLAPLGVSARSRRRRVVAQGGSLLWAADPDAPKEIMEDPFIMFGKFVKKASKNFWRRVRKRSTAAAQKNDDPQTIQPVLEIKPDGYGGDILALASSEKEERATELGGGQNPTRRASWSSPTERWTLSRDEAKHRSRRSTGDLPRLSMVS
ncbi:hypothetical protein BS17DRAFT_393085 [Gyrodon lividus]|nr:hypothetical protein BS17DRAFT_393085 [Gyrodon lividus]